MKLELNKEKIEMRIKKFFEKIKYFEESSKSQSKKPLGLLMEFLQRKDILFSQKKEAARLLLGFLKTINRNISNKRLCLIIKETSKLDKTPSHNTFDLHRKVILFFLSCKPKKITIETLGVISWVIKEKSLVAIQEMRLGRPNSPSLLEEAWERFLRQEKGKVTTLLIKLEEIIKKIPLLRVEALEVLTNLTKRQPQVLKEKAHKTLEKILNDKKRYDKYDKSFLELVYISRMLLREGPPPKIIKVG